MMHGTTKAAEILESFDTDGFVALRRFFAGDELAEITSRVDRFIRDVVPRLPPGDAFYEQKGDVETLKQIKGIEQHDRWFKDLFESGHFRDLAELVLRGPVVPKNLQYFNKPPGIGLPTPPHQDGYYFMLDPCQAVTMWFSLDAVDEENGCVRYVRGSHRTGLREHRRTQTLGFSQGIAGFPTAADLAHEVAVPAEPGDLLVHHALTVHRAEGNRSTRRSRRALGLVYYGEQARQDVAAHAAYQQQLAADMKATGKI